MTQEKYQPTPAPLSTATLPEYVLRELRRVGNVINTGFENLEASLSAVAAAATQVSASAGMRVYSATAGVVVLELDGSNLTSRSSSQTELYYLAWDASMSHAVMVPGDSMPGAGGGGGGGGGVSATAQADLMTVVRINAIQSASYNVVYSLSWQEALVDTLGAFSGGTATGLSIPQTGIYELTMFAQVPSNATGNQKGFKVHRNSAALSNNAAVMVLIFDAAEAGERAGSAVVYTSLNAGDVLHFSVYQNAINPAMDLLSAFFAESCQFSIRKVGSGIATLATLGGLNDVSFSASPTYGDMMIYDGTVWRQTTGLLVDEIIADTPTGYWRLNESSLAEGTVITDSSGNGNHMSLWGTGHTSIPAGYPFATYGVDNAIVFAAGTSKGANIVSSLSTSYPAVGDWTVEFIAIPLSSSYVSQIFGSIASGETAPTNAQVLVRHIGTGFEAFWEYNAGTNTQVASGFKAIPGRANHVIAVKDGTANTVTFWINGARRSVSYANEPTDGSSVTKFWIAGDDATAASSDVGLCHVAYYANKKLSDDRIMAHFKASGLL